MAPPWTGQSLMHALRPGGAVILRQDRSFRTVVPHYFVVVNFAPSVDQDLLMVVASSQLEKVRFRRGLVPDITLVEVQLGEYCEFDKVSVFDCNAIFSRPREEILGCLQRGEVQILQPLPAVLFGRVRTGILASPLITPVLKCIVDPTYVLPSSGTTSTSSSMPTI